MTRHQAAYLQPMPAGNYAVLVLHEGPGGDNFLASLMASDHEFDRWFVGSVTQIHGIDDTGPMPPMAQRRL